MSFINRPIKTPFFYGWLILAVVATGAFVATSIAGIVLGGIQYFIFEDTGWNRSNIGVAAAAGVWCSGVVAPFAGRLTDKYGPRTLMPLGAIYLGLTLFGLGWFHSLKYFYFATITARAISQPILIGVVPRTIAVNFFLKRRNTALALTGMFRPISGAIIVQIVSLFASTYGWRSAFSFLGIFSLALSLPMILIIRRRPEDLGLLPDGVRHEISDSNETVLPKSADFEPEISRVTNDEQSSWTGREVLRTPAFWLVALTVMCSITGSSAIGFSMVPYLADEANLPASVAVGVLSLSTFLSLSNLGWGYLADKISPRWSMIIALTGSGGVILYLFLVNSIVSAYVFGLCWGIIHSSLEVIVYMILAQYFGRVSYGVIAGSLRPFEAAGLGLGQILGPLMYDLLGNYTSMIIMSGGLQLVAAFFIFLARPPRRNLSITS
ncbi:MAG: MFS transporter [Chloroflexota bacterium]|nr:MFS transporter [Chloroflexota bacterium]